jgi:hypothetical protein
MLHTEAEATLTISATGGIATARYSKIGKSPERASKKFCPPYRGPLSAAIIARLSLRRMQRHSPFIARRCRWIFRDHSVRGIAGIAEGRTASGPTPRAWAWERTCCAARRHTVNDRGLSKLAFQTAYELQVGREGRIAIASYGPLILSRTVVYRAANSESVNASFDCLDADTSMSIHAMFPPV